MILVESFTTAQKVYEETQNYLERNFEIKREIYTYNKALHFLPEIIWQPVEKIFSGHLFPILEAIRDVESSKLFAELGFYKYSQIALRNTLELGLLSIYWDREDRSHIDIQKWLNSQENTPYKKEIISKILKIPNISEYQKYFNLERDINELYQEFSNFIHSKGMAYSSRFIHPVFEEAKFLKWYQSFKRVLKLICILHVLKYPLGLQNLPLNEKFGLETPLGIPEEHVVENIKEIFSLEELEILQRISDKDPMAISIKEYVNSLPDITREEMERQILNLEKLTIKGMGFEKWLKNKLDSIEVFGLNSEQKAESFHIINIVTSWAIEEGFLKVEDLNDYC